MNNEKKVEHYQNTILDVKSSIVRNINNLTEELIIPGEMDYVELPERIRMSNAMGEHLDDYIFAVRKGQAIINSMFDDSTPELVSLPVETLIDILKQIQEFRNEKY